MGHSYPQIIKKDEDVLYIFNQKKVGIVEAIMAESYLFFYDLSEEWCVGVDLDGDTFSEERLLQIASNMEVP